MRAVDLIQKKRDGQELTSSEIEWLIEGYVSGTVPDYQMSAFAMAVYFKGMTTREISDLTMNMVKTGQEFDLSAIDGVKVDKHSTGGVGDKVTLILAPLVASFGVPVAKMSGRGLGHTGGTIDKLESIKGYQVERSQEDFIRQVQDITHFICELAQIMLGLANVNKTVEEVRQHLENGQALAKFEEMVQAQGGDLEDLYRPVNVAHVVEIPAQETGVISALPAMDFGLYAMRLGAGRAVKSDVLDYETGIVFEKKIGDSVQKGEIVAKVYTNEKIPPQLVTDFQKCVKISDEVKKIREIVEIIS